jgi:putative spermidine/putrescine transport system substrate-binding protein
MPHDDLTEGTFYIGLGDRFDDDRRRIRAPATASAIRGLRARLHSFLLPRRPLEPGIETARSIPHTLLMLALACAFLMAPPPASGNAEAKELRILAPTGYADADWVKQFETETGADVSVMLADTDDDVWARIKGSEGTDFDLFAVGTARLQRYVDAGLTTPFDLEAVPNRKDVLPRFRYLSNTGVKHGGRVHAIPFAYDSIGLIYDTDTVIPPPDSVNALWDARHAGKVLAFDDGERSFSATALAIGIADPFHLTAEQIEQVAERLIELKHNALGFYTTPTEALRIFRNKDVALVWANYGQPQLKLMKEAGAHVAYVNPREGALAWLDAWAMTSGVQDKALAQAWVDFVLRKAISGAMSARTGFGNTVVPAPNAADSDRIVWLEPVEDPARRADLWNRIKSAP